MIGQDVLLLSELDPGTFSIFTFFLYFGLNPSLKNERAALIHWDFSSEEVQKIF